MAARFPGAATQIKFDRADALAGIGVEHETGENAVLMAGFDSYGTDGETIHFPIFGCGSTLNKPADQRRGIIAAIASG